jgi:F-type H+-transporting ATPase subunit a
MAVSLKPELLDLGGLHVPNSFLTAVVIVILLILFFAIYTPKISVKPRTRLQLILESIVTGFHDLAEGIMGKKAAKTFFPVIFTFFVLILTSNWFGLMPFSGSIGFAEKAHDDKGLPVLVVGEIHEKAEDSIHAEEAVKEGSDEHETVAATEETHEEETSAFQKALVIPFFRSPSADLNFTIALAIISFGLIQYAGLRSLGWGHLAKFFDYRVSIGKGVKILFTPLMFLINFLWKTLELILEVAKIISFSFRLFGNIFAGEVLLLVMTTLTFGIATLPFLGLEIFVGLVQAIVFIFLTMVFIKVGSEHH